MKRANIVSSIIVMSIGVFFYSLTYDFPTLAIQKVGPALMPRIYCVLLIGLGLILLMNTLRTRQPDKTDNAGSIKLSILAMGIVLVYLVLIPIVGFYIATVLVVFTLLLILRVRKRLVLLFVPIGTSLFIYGVFEFLLKVSIPHGLFF